MISDKISWPVFTQYTALSLHPLQERPRCVVSSLSCPGPAPAHVLAPDPFSLGDSDGHPWGGGGAALVPHPECHSATEQCALLAYGTQGTVEEELRTPVPHSTCQWAG